MAEPSVDCVLPQQSLMEKMPYEFSHTPTWWGHLSVDVLFKRTETKHHITIMHCVCVCGGASQGPCIWRSEDKWEKFVLSLHHVGPRDQSQVIRLDDN